MPKLQLEANPIGKALLEHFPNHMSNLENLDYMNIESVARKLPKTVSAEQLRNVCVLQQQAVIRGLHSVNLYADMAMLSPDLDFSYVPIKHLEDKIRQLESRQQMDLESDIQEESSEDHLSVGKGQIFSAEDTGFPELRNFMDEEQMYRKGAWLHQNALLDFI